MDEADSQKLIETAHALDAALLRHELSIRNAVYAKLNGIAHVFRIMTYMFASSQKPRWEVVQESDKTTVNRALTAVGI